MATECDLYVLLLGPDYGMDSGDGRSATEIEYDAAHAHDPTKVLVFLKNDTTRAPDAHQERFIKKVTDYSHGYWRSKYANTDTLRTRLQDSCLRWLKDRVGIGTHLGPFAFFVSNAVQMRPAPHVGVEYKVTGEQVQLEYEWGSRVHIVVFKKDDLIADFWGALRRLESWLRGSYFECDTSS
jgi:hypothetical protein